MPGYKDFGEEGGEEEDIPTEIIIGVMNAEELEANKERVLANLMFKPFDDDEITITTAEANNLTASMTLIIPAIVALCGIVVIIRRKHS